MGGSFIKVNLTSNYDAGHTVAVPPIAALMPLEAPVESTHQFVGAVVVFNGDDIAHALAAPVLGLPQTAVEPEAVLAAAIAEAIVVFCVAPFAAHTAS